MTKSTLTTETLKDFIKGQGYGVAPSAVVAICEQLLAVREAQSVPVQWGAPKTVRQLIQQLQTLDQDLETTALLRMPADFRDGSAIKQVPLYISYERLNGQWLAQYKGDGRLVLAFWAKADDRPEGERGELLTAPPAPAVPGELLDAMAEVIRISDRDHEAWNRAKAAISACRAAKPVAPIEMTGALAMTKYGIKRSNYTQWVKGWNACRASVLTGGKP